MKHKTGKGTEEYKSALFKHQSDNGHLKDYDNVEIIAKASNDRKLLLKEMLLINDQKPSLNTQKWSVLFSLIIGNKK